MLESSSRRWNCLDDRYDQDLAAAEARALFEFETTGAVLGGRDGWDAAVGDQRPYGGAWKGPIFVLSHHPEDATPVDGATFLSCDPAEAVRIGLEAAAGKNLEVFSPTIGCQLLQLGLIGEIDLQIAPVLLGQRIRLYLRQVVHMRGGNFSVTARWVSPAGRRADPPFRQVSGCSTVGFLARRCDVCRGVTAGAAVLSYGCR